MMLSHSLLRPGSILPHVGHSMPSFAARSRINPRSIATKPFQRRSTPQTTRRTGSH